MTQLLVKMELEAVLEQEDVFKFINSYDGEINKLNITNDKGDDMNIECIDSNFIEVLELFDGEEYTILNNKPELKYYISRNKAFEIKDMLRITGEGDFNIIINDHVSLLFNADNGQHIKYPGVNTLYELREYLHSNSIQYEVLRKIA